MGVFVLLAAAAAACDTSSATVGGDAAMRSMSDCGDIACETGTSCQMGVANPTCVDVDECATGTHDCSSAQVCVNTLGGFSCFNSDSPCLANPCGAGYDCVEAGGGRQCIDQDECAIANACPPSADCFNMDGATAPLCQDRAQCANGEHTCDLETEVCVELDTAPGFDCELLDRSDAGVQSDAGSVVPNYPKDGFCATGDWAFCEDFDAVANVDVATLDATGLTYRAHGAGTTGGDEFEMDCTVSGPCEPYMQGGAFHTISDDSSFGAVVVRPKRPFDFSATGGGHLHFESDLRLNGTNRKHIVVRISSEATMDFPDVRQFDVAVSNAPALDIVFLGGDNNNLSARRWSNGSNSGVFSSGFKSAPISGTMHAVDIYLTRTSLRIEVDGDEWANTSMADLGFDKGYVHLGHLAYNPAKDNCYPTRDSNIAVWDNIAFDGAPMAEYGLVASGQQEAVWFTEFTRKWFGNDQEKTAPVGCEVRGVQAVGADDVPFEHYTVWRATVPAGSPLTKADIDCYGSPVYGLEVMTP